MKPHRLIASRGTGSMIVEAKSRSSVRRLVSWPCGV